MTGIVLALVSSVLLASADAFKKHLAATVDSWVVIWLTLLGGVLVAALVHPFQVREVAITDPTTFWYFLGVSILASVAAEVAFMTALRSAEFSIVMPLCSLFPVAIALFGMAFLSEVPTIEALIGIVIVVGGGCLLSIERDGEEKFQWRSILSSQALRWMIVCSLCLATIVTTTKKAAPMIDSISFIGLILGGSLVLFTVALIAKRVPMIAMIRSAPLPAFSVALLWGLGYQLNFVANEFTLVAYVAAIGQLSIAFAVFLGVVAFREQAQPFKLLVSGAMIVGALMIVLAERA
ncbi:MAG: DMT family transporter [Deltaproteobacteria bacterium]|nr:DMT family transporter [Deltaproteobacteria bacterium]